MNTFWIIAILAVAFILLGILVAKRTTFYGEEEIEKDYNRHEAEYRKKRHNDAKNDRS